jgi:hypothetical protein
MNRVHISSDFHSKKTVIIQKVAKLVYMQGDYMPNFLNITLQYNKFWEESLLSFDTTWTAQKTTPPTILRYRGNVFTDPLPSNDKGDTQTHRLSLIRHGPHIKRSVQQYFYCCMCIGCRGNVFTEPLPSNDRGIHI